ncbi:mannonate dehydratase [Kaistia algarum]|uniref:mannonate dehydratase n=1 Tax=Kaistia algarum TaxID=2083279 RepID=UPI000CE794C5|nr:mannonate dehydratase [Kaistia algarum]MCX5513525.1 mannonate dehydratase [Kaistia algarum]PPE78151.1 mannonate dehydratase [Kaistia algarum]
MEQCWRWFGPEDAVTLDHVKQAGATGIVTALHHIYDGRAWTLDDVLARKAIIEAAGLRWSVCESIPVPSEIKLRNGAYREKIDAWKGSLVSLAQGGIDTICYNFMPVVDWTRTNLMWKRPTGGYALRFDMVDFVTYDVHILKRPNAAASYSDDLLKAASTRAASISTDEEDRLEKNIIAGLPGGEDSFTREGIARQIARFDGLGHAEMQEHLIEFVKEIAPLAEELGVRLGIHADDPPFSLFGLPRVVSTAADARHLLSTVDIPANGLTLCAGSYGARPDNDLPAMAEEFGPRVHFVHLRNVTREADGSFFEDDHLAGGTNMVDLIVALTREERRRKAEGRTDTAIPMRPDHGHLLVDDIDKVEKGMRVNPGYSCIGRLKGLAELRGVMQAVEQLVPA